MLLKRPVFLIQQYANGDALVTVFTSKCAPPTIQQFRLSDTKSFTLHGGPGAIVLLHNGTPGKTDGNHFNAVMRG